MIKYKAKQGAENKYKADLENCTYGYLHRFGELHFALRKKGTEKKLSFRLA